MNDTFSKEQWKAAAAGVPKNPQIDIVEKIRMSYELINKKCSPKAGIVASDKITNEEELLHRKVAVAQAQPQVVNKVVPSKLTRGNTKRSSLKGSSIHLEPGTVVASNTNDFNTTFS